MGQKKCGTGTAAIVISKKRQRKNALSLFLSQYLYSEALLSLQNIFKNDIITVEIIPITLCVNGGEIMRTGMKKKDKVTEIYFNEADSIMYGRTCNTKLKKQLRQLAVDYPNQCKISVDADTDMIEFEINKNRLTFRINPELSAEQKRQLSAEAKKHHNLPLKNKES